jgi:hypothetical protein
MDEVEFARLIGNIRVLVKDVSDPVIRNPMLAMVAALDGLNERIIELQTEEDDD